MTKTAPSKGVSAVLDGQVTPSGITTSLNPGTRMRSWVEKLQKSAHLAYMGNNVNGIGFVLQSEQAESLIAVDARSRDVIFGYLTGQDVSNDPQFAPSRQIIDFGGMSQSEAERFPTAFEHVRKYVKPQRDLLGDDKKAVRERWWQYEKLAPRMRAAIKPLRRCIVISLVGKAVMPVMVPTGQVLSHRLGVFASDDTALLALLSSAPHFWWTLDRTSTLETRINYSLSDVVETLVRPTPTDRLREAGALLDRHRRTVMLARTVGLTDTYNLVHDPDCEDQDIVDLRRIHEEIDKATVEAYGWHDLLGDSEDSVPVDPTHETFPLDHGFHETDQGTRYTIGLLARTEIIDRLRQLNHQAYADEVHLGLHKGVTDKKAREKHPDLPPPSPEAIRKRKEQLAARGGSDFGEGAEGALF
jgi:hypothetical protein